MSDFCLVVEGKSFATIRAHCPSVLPKVCVCVWGGGKGPRIFVCVGMHIICFSGVVL